MAKVSHVPDLFANTELKMLIKFLMSHPAISHNADLQGSALNQGHESGIGRSLPEPCTRLNVG